MRINLLKAAIARNGMNISKLCDATGINRTTMNRHMRDMKQFTQGQITKISIALNLSLDEMTSIFFDNIVS